jgi:mono/diheme cytochrome c family protein
MTLPGVARPATAGDSGRTCPYCRFALKEGASVIDCGACSAVHHDECWTDNEGCAMIGCAGPQPPPAPTPSAPTRTRRVPPPPPVSGTSAAGPAAPAPAGPPPPPAAPSPASSTNRPVIAALVVLAAVIVAAATAVVLSRGEPPATPPHETVALAPPPAPAAPTARRLFAEGTASATACGACHTLADAGTSAATGPDLAKVLADKESSYIRAAILEPDAEVSPGFQAGIMPKNYGDTLSVQELDTLVTYLLDSATDRDTTPTDDPDAQAEEIRVLLRSYYGAVRSGDYQSAWALLSPSYKRWKQSNGGYAKWEKAERRNRAHLRIGGLQVDVRSFDEASGVAEIYVEGMRLRRADGSYCAYEGITWAKRGGDGDWRYDQGYLQNPARSATWRPRSGETLGYTCDTTGY